MFDATQAITNKIVSDLKRVSFITSLVTQSLFILYYVYSLIVGSGYLAVNIVLLAVTVSYLVFFIIMYAKDVGKESKSIKKTVKTVYRLTKYAIHAFTLGMAMYLLYSDIENATFIAVLLTALNAVGFIAQLVIEILRQTASRYVKLLQTAINKDVQPYIDKLNKLKNPGATVAEAVNRPIGALARKFASKMGVTAEEPEEDAPSPSDRHTRRVDEIAAVYAEDKNKKKKEKKEQDKQKRKEEREAISAEMRENFKTIGQGLKFMLKPQKADKSGDKEEPAAEEITEATDYEIIPPDISEWDD